MRTRNSKKREIYIFSCYSLRIVLRGYTIQGDIEERERAKKEFILNGGLSRSSIHCRCSFHLILLHPLKRSTFYLYKYPIIDCAFLWCSIQLLTGNYIYVATLLYRSSRLQFFLFITAGDNKYRRPFDLIFKQKKKDKRKGHSQMFFNVQFQLIDCVTRERIFSRYKSINLV
jgi:hypothetical protein